MILTISSGVAPYVRGLTPELAAVAAFVCAFAASGYALGLLAARLMRRPREQQVTMTYLCGMRNISAGAVIAGEYFPGEVMFPVVIGTLFQQVLAATYGSLLRRLPTAEEAGRAARCSTRARRGPGARGGARTCRRRG